MYYYTVALPMDREALLKKLAERIRSLRVAKGLTQEALAHKIGRDQQAIQRLETARTNPTITFLEEVAQALEVSLCDLLGDPKN